MLQTVTHQGAGRKHLFNVKICVIIESWDFKNQELSNFTEKMENKFVFGKSLLLSPHIVTIAQG